MSVTFAREIGTSHDSLTVMALAGVACIESYRGNGFGKAVVEAAFDRVRDGAFEVSLFQTSTAVRPFYEKLGCSAVENPTVNSLNEADPEARPWWDPEVMIYPAGAAAWPEGPIDLRGPAW
jgi:GNAT superfamily N-acetyltransferase